MNSGLSQIAPHLPVHNHLDCVCSACEHHPWTYSKGYFIIELLQLKNNCFFSSGRHSHVINIIKFWQEVEYLMLKNSPQCNLFTFNDVFPSKY